MLDLSALQLSDWWRDTYLDIDDWRDLIVYACAGLSTLSLSFPVVDDPTAISDGLRHCFEAVIHNFRPTLIPTIDIDWEAWSAEHRDLDPRVQLGSSGWTVVDDTTRPVDIFGA